MRGHFATLSSDRIRAQKIIKCVIAYVRAALAMAGAKENFVDVFQWPDSIGRSAML